MPCSIQIKKSALTELQQVPKTEQPRIIAAIDKLIDQPYAGRLLKGELSGLRRIRVGNYRIVYEVNERDVLILILRIAHRRHIYK